MAFDHIWLILFSDEDVFDVDYSVELLEQLPSTLSGFTSSERDALSEVGQAVKNRLLAEPDEYGYTQRTLVSDEQRRFLDAVIDQGIYSDEWWTN